MRTHGLLWLALIVIVTFFAPLFVRADVYRTVLGEEVAAALRYYSDDEVREIRARADRLYTWALLDTHIEAVMGGLFARSGPMPRELAPGVEVPDSVASFTDRLANYGAALTLQIYLFFFRLAHAALWMRYICPFICAAIYDGIMVRNVKLQTLAYTSPTVYNASWHLIIFIAFGALVMFSIATVMSVFVFPVALSVIGLLVRLVLCNVQHSA